MPTAWVHGRELFHLRRGRGEPLLLVQGMGGNHLAWGEPFLGLLEDRHELILYDHRGVGRSGRSEEPFTIADLAGDAIGLLDALGVERAHVMGISMGGMVAQELALREPRRVRTLVLGCTYSGGEGSRLTAEGVVQRLSEAMASGDRDRAVRAGWEVNVSPGYSADDSNFATFYEMATALPAPVPVILQQFQAIAAHDTSERLRSIRAPTLVIHGDRDEMLDVSNGRHVAERIPGARLEVLRGVGHMFWWEQPKRTADLVLEHTAPAAVRQTAAEEAQ